tara:strand:- start:4191 stop:4544 length:354 start_codon:yes stop_codon:yes gene_type:complete
MKISTYRNLLIFYAILILSVSSIPGNSIPRFVLLSWDKLLHIIEYSILGFLSVNSVSEKSKNKIIIISLFCLCFAISDEMWQSFIPGRFSSALDIIADGIGILIGSIFALRYGSSKK